MIDTSAVGQRGDPDEVARWLTDQRVFISSAMGDTADEREAVARACDELGARAVRFEEFGRDAEPEEAYLFEVDAATIYFGILNELYGRQDRVTGFSATEAEYLRAREQGKRITVFIARDAPAREGHLRRFIDERLRVFVTTETYTDADDLSRRVRRRLEELAAEQLSPWVKLGRFVFRALEIVDAGDSATIRARPSEEVTFALEQWRDQPHRRETARLAYGLRVSDAELVTVRRTVRAGGVAEVEIDLGRMQAPAIDPLRVGLGDGLGPDALVELAMRSLFLGEPLPDQVAMMGLAGTGIEEAEVLQCFGLPNEIAGAITQLVVSDGLVGTGRASRITKFELGPRAGNERRIQIEWEEPRARHGAAPGRRFIDGGWTVN